MKWYVALLILQTILLSAVFSLLFAWSTFDLLIDQSGMHGNWHIHYNMTKANYLALQAICTIANLSIFFFSIWAFKKKHERYILIASALFFGLFIGMISYSLYCT